MNILDKIIETKKIEVANSKSRVSINDLRDSEFFNQPTHSLKLSLKSKSGIIAEFKRKSPSKGNINNSVNSNEVVENYVNYGASGVSILTDETYFGGSLQDILNLTETCTIPILRKDFMIDEYQFYEAKSVGADVVLLIASCLSPDQVEEFTELSHQLGLEVLLEIHSEEELKHFNSKIDFVGINNRNLKNFEVDLQHSVDLKNLLPKNTLSIAESGIYSIESYNFLKEKGFDGFLMGEYFMKNQNPGKAFSEFIKAIEL